MKVGRLVGALALAALISVRASAQGRERRHALIVGYNGVPRGLDPGSVAPLKYADDDALAFYEFEQESGNDAILLTLADSDTRLRYPSVADAAQLPTLSVLRASVAKLSEAMEAEAREGDTPVFTLFYSGHGTVDDTGEPSLTLADGALSRGVLSEEILNKVPAKVVHLIIDACHADALVRFRDATAAQVALSPRQIATTLLEASRSRYPQVGILIASSGSNAASEWDRYGSGVFTHEVLSGLRGAADVNGDGRVEYSELGAFVAAANREVADPAARLQTMIEPPAAAVHTALSELVPGATSGRLVGIPRSVGRFFVEDTRGNRLVDAFPELGFAMSISLPSNQKMFLRSGDREAELQLRPGEEQRFAGLSFQPQSSRTRDAVESSLRAGLFGAPYGPEYYRGYVDRSDAVAVNTLVSTPMDAIDAGGNPPAGRPVLRGAMVGAGAALLASSAVLGGLAWKARSDFDNTNLEASAAADRQRYYLDLSLALGLLVSAAAALVTADLMRPSRRDLSSVDQ